MWRGATEEEGEVHSLLGREPFRGLDPRTLKSGPEQNTAI